MRRSAKDWMRRRQQQKKMRFSAKRTRMLTPSVRRVQRVRSKSAKPAFAHHLKMVTPQKLNAEDLQSRIRYLRPQYARLFQPIVRVMPHSIGDHL